WTREIVQNELHITHNFWPVDWDADGTDEILLASLEGVFLFKKSADRWVPRKLADGDPEKRGAGEIKVGRLPGGKRYLATVEPWHGHQAVIYTEPESPESLWKRRVLVERHKGGHALWTADLTGTGVDSLVVGFRGIPEGKKEECVVYVFHPLDETGERWEKMVLDEKGLGCEDALVIDLNADGRPDVVGIGRSTRNVKIYWNEGRKE
ncbi:MAG: FG-GAP repeat domain-containing protein, partial [Planctomycetota bacterium]